MSQLSRKDLSDALELVHFLGENATSALEFARLGVVAVDSFVASDLVTLSVCDLVTGHRQVLGLPGQKLSGRDIATFDRHFYKHPLVRFHGVSGGRTTHRISDSVGRPQFHRTDLYNEYYRAIGIEHAMAVPLYVDGRNLVSIVLNRARRDFSERDRERLDLIRPHLGWLYRHACILALASSGAPRGAPAETVAMTPIGAFAEESLLANLTPREREVLDWVARGKTDKEIARAIGRSARTVQKHLEHIYEKLGVETRTAAARRYLAAAD